MELWRANRYVRFVKKEIKKQDEFALCSFCKSYFPKIKHRWFFIRFTPKQIHIMEQFAIDKGFLVHEINRKGDQCYRVTSEGLLFSEGWIIGFLVEATKRYSSLILIIFGSASLLSVIRYVWQIFTD